MKLHRIKLTGLTLILLIVGCIEQEKDDLTLPARFQLKIYLAGNYSTWEDPYDITGWDGQIGIQSIRFEGKREAGVDVFFETDPKMDFKPVSLTGKSGPAYDFDIPRGIYNDMKWEIDLKKIVTQAIYSYVDIDSLNTGLFVSGEYDYWYYDLWDYWYWNNWQDYPWEDEKLPPVMFAIDDTMKLTFRSQDNVKFNMAVDRYYEVILSLDLISAIKSLSKDSIRNLETSIGYPGEVVLISSKKNENLYKDLLNRMILYVQLN